MTVLALPLVVLGALLLAASFFLPKELPKSNVQKGTGMMPLPESWDERQISLDIERNRSNPGALSTYFDGIVSRFVNGQNVQTVEARTKFLQSFNKYSEVARESYKWKRYMEGGRASLEEDLEDIRAKVQLEKAKAELDEVGGEHDLAELQKEAKRLEVMVEIAQKRKTLEGITKPDPPPLPPPEPLHVPTAAERRAEEKAELEASEKQVREAIRLTEADPTLHEEQKRRKLNLLEERLAEIHEKQVRLL